ncbi:MAG: hypothetical protein IJ087_15480 [Eggerthellaceae bacterium]|nr:hypothetical protein [Eggerthellaceae bacterium]
MRSGSRIIAKAQAEQRVGNVKVDGEFKAEIAVLTCISPLEGHARRVLKLINETPTAFADSA